MASTKKRIINLEGDSIEVDYIYDEKSGRFLGDYPFFEEKPRYTPRGRPWVNAIKDDCPYAEEEFGDCGSCSHFATESESDLIGVCMNEKMKK